MLVLLPLPVLVAVALVAVSVGVVVASGDIGGFVVEIALPLGFLSSSLQGDRRRRRSTAGHVWSVGGD